jgi:hypothetical protein
MTASPIMRDHARPSKRELLAGRHNRVHVLFDINLDHCAAAAAVGLLVGFLCWHQAPSAPTEPASPYYQKFEVEIPQR